MIYKTCTIGYAYSLHINRQLRRWFSISFTSISMMTINLFSVQVCKIIQPYYNRLYVSYVVAWVKIIYSWSAWWWTKQFYNSYIHRKRFSFNETRASTRSGRDEYSGSWILFYIHGHEFNHASNLLESKPKILTTSVHVDSPVSWLLE